MVVTRICRHWRTIALSTPMLWKNLYTRTIHASSRYGGWNHEIPISLIHRSSPVSLRLSCTAHVLSDDPNDTDEPDVFYDALRNNVERLESFQLSSSPFLDNTVVDILDLPLPRLSSLQLRVINGRELTRNVDTGIITFEAYAEDVELPRMFGGGPSDLRKFSLWDYTCWPHNTFPKLTHLSLHEQVATPTLEEFFDMLDESPCLEVLHLERAGPEIPHRTSILPKRRVALPHLREARFLVFDPNPMNFQLRILECITMPSFIEILFSLPLSDKEDLHRLLPGFPGCDNVNDITFVSSFEDNPCAAVKLRSKTQLTIQTNSEAVASYLPSLGAQFPHLTHILFQNTLGDLPWHHSGQLLNLDNLTTITLSGYLGMYDVPTLMHLLEDQSSSGDVPCPKLAQISIYAVGLNLEKDVWLGGDLSAKRLVENPRAVVQRNPDKNFEVHLALLSEEVEMPPLDVQWTRRW